MDGLKEPSTKVARLAEQERPMHRNEEGQLDASDDSDARHATNASDANLFRPREVATVALAPDIDDDRFLGRHALCMPADDVVRDRLENTRRTEQRITRRERRHPQRQHACAPCTQLRKALERTSERFEVRRRLAKRLMPSIKDVRRDDEQT